MPRRISTKAQPTPVWKLMNLRKQLEDQLESVIAFEEIIVTDDESLPIPERSRVQEVALVEEKQRDEESDIALLESLEMSDAPTIIPIVKRAHTPSPHQVALSKMARRIDERELDTSYGQAPQWNISSSPLPQSDILETLYALDVPALREEWIVDQYTPTDAEHAYQQQQRFLSTLRLPIMTFVAMRPVALPKVTLRQQEAETAIIHPTLFHRWWDAVKNGWNAMRGKSREMITDTTLANEELITSFEHADMDWQQPIIVPRISSMRVMTGFLVLALLVSLPAGAVSIARSVSSSWGELSGTQEHISQTAKQALATSPEQASDLWTSTAQQFALAEKSLNDINVVAVALSSLLPQTRNTYTTIRALTNAGEQASLAAALLSKGMNEIITSDSANLLHRLELADTYIQETTQRLESAVASYRETDLASLPEEKRDAVKTVGERLEQGLQLMQEASLLMQHMPELLGKSHQRRYVLVFQNSSELRPTGGFMGSMAEVVIDRGDIKRVQVMGGGPYDLHGQLKTRVKPPEPFYLVSDRWEFQDANWHPDFAASAKTIQQFWSDAGQPTIDGVLAINVAVMERLLEITGPVELPEYQKTFTAESFRLEMQKAVELEYNKTENTPKKIIGDLIPVIIERVKNGDSQTKQRLLAMMNERLVTKDIQLYFTREEEQEVFRKLGWTGEWGEAIGDSSAIIGTNIAGQKSDAAIRERVHHDIRIDQEGVITDSVTLVREHTAGKGELFTGVNNVQFIRFYTPKGAELLSANGFNAPSSSLFSSALPKDEESPLLSTIEKQKGLTHQQLVRTESFDRQSFGGWIQLKPGETSTTTLTYRLPQTAFHMAERWYKQPMQQKRAAYVLQSMSQSGAQRTVTYTVSVPEGWKQQWTNRSMMLDEPWNQDRLYAILFETP